MFPLESSWLILTPSVQASSCFPFCISPVLPDVSATVAMQLWAHSTSGRWDVISSQRQAASRGFAARSGGPTYHHKRKVAWEQMGDLWWIKNELHTVAASWKEDCTCRFDALTWGCIISPSLPMTWFVFVSCRLNIMRSLRRGREERALILRRATPVQVFNLTHPRSLIKYIQVYYLSVYSYLDL